MPVLASDIRVESNKELQDLAVGKKCIVGTESRAPEYAHTVYYLATVTGVREVSGDQSRISVEVTGRLALDFVQSRLRGGSTKLAVLEMTSGSITVDSMTRVYTDTPSVREMLRHFLLMSTWRDQETTRANHAERLHQETFAAVLRDGLVGPAVKEAVREELAKK